MQYKFNIFFDLKKKYATDCVLCYFLYICDIKLLIKPLSSIRAVD